MTSQYATIFIGFLVALVGSGGIVFGALRFNREDAKNVVEQQSQILDDMKELYEVTKEERDALREQVLELRKEVVLLRKAIREMGKNGG